MHHYQPSVELSKTTIDSLPLKPVMITRFNKQCLSNYHNYSIALILSDFGVCIDHP